MYGVKPPSPKLLSSEVPTYTGRGEVVAVQRDRVDGGQQLSAAPGFEVDDPADLSVLRHARFDLGDPVRAEGHVRGIGGERRSGRGREQHGAADQCPLQPHHRAHRLSCNPLGPGKSC
jgi:hypothetical protein